MTENEVLKSQVASGSKQRDEAAEEQFEHPAGYPVAACSPRGFVLDALLPPYSLDHVIVINERHLRAVLAEFADYYNLDRPHRSLGLQSPLPRPLIRDGPVTRRPVLGGLHNVYGRAG